MICTNFEQSKHLFNVLKMNPSLGDMSWYRSNEMYPYELHSLNETHFRMEGDDLVPACSLNALFNIMPKELDYENDKYSLCLKYDHECPMLYYVNKSGKLIRFGKRCTPDAWDALDAAYQMVCWLREQGLI